MKKLITLLAVVCYAELAGASTSITSPTVSGHWTLAGSPYNIYNNIGIDPTQSLTIDPGVQVVFYGAYNINVSGILHAAGTASQPIIFTVNDTTGFSTDTVTSAGGWHGIELLAYSGTGPDSSILEYCNMSYTKFDSSDDAIWPSMNILDIQRSVTVKNCNFSQNICNPHCGVPSFLFYLKTGEQFEMAGCNIYNNLSYSKIISISDYHGGSMYIHDNAIYQNVGFGGAIYCAYANLLFENNQVYQNSNGASVAGGTGIMTIFGSHITIKGNRFYNNTTYGDATIFSGSGFIDIIDNFICNNQHTSGACGAIDGGGALNLNTNSAIPVDSTFYNVINNVIANNYSPFHGGAINILNAPVNIINNQIINNSSLNGGAIYSFGNYNMKIKNNIFFGNTTNGMSSVASPNVVAFTNASIEYDHNWIESSPGFNLNVAGTFTITGDTTTNIQGSNPGLVSPTSTSNVSESAIDSNFGLLPSSPCINMGDTAGFTPDSVDFAGNPRLRSGRIDIGAFEFDSTLYYALYTPIRLVEAKKMSIYPNPASSILSVFTSGAKGAIVILDVSGRSIQEKTVVTTLTAFDISTLPRGIYFVVWNTGSNSKEVQKVVIE